LGIQAQVRGKSLTGLIIICDALISEIAETRSLVNGLVEFVQKQDYENPEDFAQFISGSLVKKCMKL
jgi:hypothetical protein